MHLAHLSKRLHDVRGFLATMSDHLCFALEIRDHYPIASTDYREILAHPRDQSDAYFEEHTRASILYPLLLTWLTLLGEPQRCNRLVEVLNKTAPHMTLQIWIPDSKTDELMWHGEKDHGLAVSDLPLRESMTKTFEMLNRVIAKYPIVDQISAVRTGLFPLLFMACRHFRMPIPVHLWHAGFEEEPTSIEADE